MSVSKKVAQGYIRNNFLRTTYSVSSTPKVVNVISLVGTEICRSGFEKHKKPYFALKIDIFRIFSKN
jgi:hypothetical protein